MSAKLTIEQWVSLAQIKHNFKYTYSNAVYKGAHEPIIVTCKVHGDFPTTPHKHKSHTSGCRHCDLERKRNNSCNRITTKIFINRSMDKHGLLYDYSLSKYKAGNEVTILCKKHGAFSLEARKHWLGKGCQTCEDDAQSLKASKEFLTNAKAVHGSRYEYSKVVYKHSQKRVTITCRVHGDFPQKPNAHLNGNGCKDCGKERPLGKTTEDFILEAQEVHGDKYSYKKSNYQGSSTELTITCKIHGDFPQTPNIHVSQSCGCPSCNKAVTNSGLSISWIEQYAKSKRLKNVQHARNTGEYRIPGTKFKVDGFHARSNTVFEFHGSCWHGDPNVYKPRSRPHPHRKDTTAKQLHKETKEREAKLVSLGYTVVVIWESDFKAGLKFSYIL